VAPFRRPYSLEPGNEKFNNHVSMIRIRSEHAIGFLKGRFQSLKKLRLTIKNEASHKFATYWILSCIALHSFAMKSEEGERGETGSDSDPFIAEGLEDDDDDETRVRQGNQTASCSSSGPRDLLAAKARREELKQALLSALEQRAERRRADEEEVV
jgi:hypothetical protein